VDDVGEVGRREVEAHLAAFDDGDVEQLVEEVEHDVRGAVHAADHGALVLGELAGGAVEHELGESTDGGEGIAKIVGGDAEKVVLGGVGLAEIVDELALTLEQGAEVKVRADAGDHLARLEGFDDVVDATGFEPGDDVFG
jgi:outer membrane lipoprotein SlyB